MDDFETAVGAPRARYDKVEAAYEGMSDGNQRAFRTLIKDPDNYSHAQIAAALRKLGYDIDRKQVQQYREKLAMGRVTL